MENLRKILWKKCLTSVGVEEIENAVLLVLKEREKAVADFKAGKKKALHFLVGEVMKKQEVKQILRWFVVV